VGTRTPDLYRVNFEVNNLKPFPHLAFPHFATPENSSKQLGFDGELMASSRALFRPNHGIVSGLPTNRDSAHGDSKIAPPWADF
jgi:hypothetical protein